MDASQEEPLNENTKITNVSEAIQNTLDPAHLDKMGLLNDIFVRVVVEIGRTEIKIRDLLDLKKDAILELDKAAGDLVDIYVNEKLISRGNIITVNGNYCVRIKTLYTQNE